MRNPRWKPPGFSGFRVDQSVVLIVVFCRSLFVILSFFFWPLYCLSFFDLQRLRLIKSRKSKKDRQYNGQKKKDKITNNDLQNTTIKTEILEISPWISHHQHPLLDLFTPYEQLMKIFFSEISRLNINPKEYRLITL
jgi:hypothetical protein